MCTPIASYISGREPCAKSKLSLAVIPESEREPVASEHREKAKLLRARTHARRNRAKNKCLIYVRAVMCVQTMCVMCVMCVQTMCVRTSR